MKSYIKFLSRHRLFTIINIVGLCLSMAFLLLLGDLIYRQTSVENFQTRGERIFALGNEKYTMSHFRVGQKLQDRFPEIEAWCAVSGYDVLLHVHGEEIQTKMLVTAPNFFEFFDYKLLTGDKKQVLTAPNQIVVSKRFAQRCWPDGNAVGQEVIMGEKDDPDDRVTYTVSGVMDDFDRSVIPSDYECVANLESHRYLNYSAYSESMNNAGSSMVFLMEKEGCNLQAKTTTLRDYLKTFFWLYQMEAVKQVRLIPLSNLYYDTKDCTFQGGELNHGNRDMAQLYVVVALLVLVFAIFNYVNLSVSLTTDRSKEMATRRLLGLSRLQVFFKLLGESIFFTAIALLIAYLMALALQDKAIELANCQIDLWKDTSLVTIVGLVGAIVFVAVLAGLVPASILSSYQPMDIVRGTFRRRVRQHWSHVLMVIQDVFAMVMLTVTLLLGSSIRQQMSQPLGYDIDNVLETWGIHNLSLTQRQAYREQLLQLPEVDAVGFGYGTPLNFLENNTTQADDGTVVSMRYLMGDSCFFNILNIHPEKTYVNEGIGVNHQLLRQFGKSDDTREIVNTSGSINLPVAALYPDFVYQNVMNEAEHPTPFLILKTDEYRNDTTSYVYRMYGSPRMTIVKYHGGREKVAHKMKALFKEFTGHDAQEVHSLEQRHHEWYEEYQRFLSVLVVFTAVALLIAVLGLMAMNSYFVGQRRREIAVRRVFGAELSSITLQLLRTVFMQSLVAAVIAIPLAYWLAPTAGSISGLHVEMQFMPLLLSLLIVLVVNVLTAAIQSWRAATENPVNSIKNE